MKMSIFGFSSFLFMQNALAQDAAVFGPPINTVSVYAKKASVSIVIDGFLNETDWELAIPINNFKQVEPFQGEPPVYRTTVKILYDSKYLYVGVFAKILPEKKE